MDEPPSSQNEITVLVEERGWQTALAEAEVLAEQAARQVLESDTTGGAREALEVTILLADDASVRTLNARYRGRDMPTNVLSFPAEAEALPGEARLLGDIVLAFETCRREAAEQGKPLSDHLVHLVVHGTLHLLGYDHEEPAEAETMEALERRLLARMGVPDPYAEHAQEAPTGEARQ